MDIAMSTAVSALQAQGSALSVVSNNLANTSTTGYKAVTTQFNDILSGVSGGTFPGDGVYAEARQNLGMQGTVASTSKTTDMAIDGRGLFPVTKGDGTGDIAYTRDGAFDTDKLGNLVLTGTDYYLVGWPTNTDGTVPALNAADVSSLKTVNVKNLNFLAKPTTTYTFSANLPAGAQTTVLTDTYTTAGGVTQSVNMSYTKLSSTSTQANYQLTVLPSNSTTTLSDGTNTSGAGLPLIYDVVVSSNGSITSITYEPTGVAMTVPASGTPFLSFTPSDISAGTVDSPTTWAGLGTPFSDRTALSTYDSLGVQHSFPVAWTSEGSNQWLMTVLPPTTPDGSTITGSLLDSAGTAVSGYSYNIKFNSDGSIGTITPLSNAPAGPVLSASWYDGATSNSAATGDAISLTLTGMTQFDTGESTPVISINSRSQDGLQSGKLSGVQITSGGNVEATFSNGQTVSVFKIPIVTFPNENGLSAQSYNVYKQSFDSGNYTLNQAGNNGSGSIQGSALEGSTVNTSLEFSNMIVAQQAYSAAAQVISVDKQNYTALIQVVQ